MVDRTLRGRRGGGHRARALGCNADRYGAAPRGRGWRRRRSVPAVAAGEVGRRPGGGHGAERVSERVRRCQSIGRLGQGHTGCRRSAWRVDVDGCSRDVGRARLAFVARPGRLLSGVGVPLGRMSRRAGSASASWAVVGRWGDDGSARMSGTTTSRSSARTERCAICGVSRVRRGHGSTERSRVTPSDAPSVAAGRNRGPRP